MNRLQEKRALLALAQRFGQPPAPGLVEEIQRLEEEQRCARLREDEIRSRLAADLQQIWGEHHELVQPPPEPQLTEDAGTEQTAQADLAAHEAVPPTRTTVAESIADKVARVITEAGVVAPDPVLAQPQKDLAQEIKYLREWVSRIAATGPGGGAGDILNLDTPVTVVNVSSYTVTRRDYYVGVNVNTSTSIVLPMSGIKAGRSLIIKDESGRCSKNEITIAGTIDNDTSGAILAIDNGALHLIYRQGWRII